MRNSSLQSPLGALEPSRTLLVTSLPQFPPAFRVTYNLLKLQLLEHIMAIDRFTASHAIRATCGYCLRVHREKSAASKRKRSRCNCSLITYLATLTAPVKSIIGCICENTGCYESWVSLQNEPEKSAPAPNELKIFTKYMYELGILPSEIVAPLLVEN